MWIYRFVVIILSLIFSANVAKAQPPEPSPTPSSSTPSLRSQFLKNIARDQKAIWTAPFHLKHNDVSWLAPIGIGTAALIATDQQTGDELAESHRQLNGSRVISYGGSAYGVAATAGAFYFIGRATHNERARETGILGAEALVNSAILVTAVKGITQRTRPSGGRSRSDFFDGGSSFPSGHSIEAWSLATVVANEYHDHRAVQIAAYGIASAVSISRFTGEKHYLSDVLIGSVGGYGIGRYVYHAHHRVSPSGGGEEEEELTEHDRRRPAIAPLFNSHAHRYGLGLAWSF
jgi:membrane-associated phospholipid phosphatase